MKIQFLSLTRNGNMVFQPGEIVDLNEPDAMFFCSMGWAIHESEQRPNLEAKAIARPETYLINPDNVVLETRLAQVV